MESKLTMLSRDELDQMLKVTRSILATTETKMEYLRMLENHKKLLNEEDVIVTNEDVKDEDPTNNLGPKKQVTIVEDIVPHCGPIKSEKLSPPHIMPKEVDASVSTSFKRVIKLNPLYRNADFVCEHFKVEKLLPQAKRRAPQAKRVRERDMMMSCQTILKKLMNHKLGCQIFNQPVNAELEGIPDYHSIINKPMDLGTIQSKLNSRQYPSPRTFADDVRLTFTNAKKFNPETHEVHQIACMLEALFEGWWKTMVVKVEASENHLQKMNNTNNNNDEFCMETQNTLALVEEKENVHNLNSQNLTETILTSGHGHLTSK